MELLIINNNHTILNWEQSKTKMVKFDECMNNEKAEILSSKLFKNRQVKKMMVVALGLALYCKASLATVSCVSTSAVGATGIDKLGWAMMGLVRQWGFWILLIWCMVDLIRSSIHGDQKQALPIVLKYTTIYAVMFLLPSIFLAIAGAF